MFEKCKRLVYMNEYEVCTTAATQTKRFPMTMLMPYLYTKTYVGLFLRRICLAFKTPPFTGFHKIEQALYTLIQNVVDASQM